MPFVQLNRGTDDFGRPSPRALRPRQSPQGEVGDCAVTVGSRLSALEAAIPVLQERLAKLVPPPLRRPPLVIGGAGERRTLRLVARYADGWHAGFPERPSELDSAVAALRRWCDETEGDPADIEWGVGVEPDDLDRFREQDAATHLEMGFSQLTLGFNGPDWAVDGGAPWLGWRDQQRRQFMRS